MDVDGIQVRLDIANNAGASSPVLQFKDHRLLWPDVEYVDTLFVESQTLPRLLAALNLNPDDDQAFVMDAQGSEFLILKGALPILGNFKFVKTEVPDFEAYKGCPQLREFTSFVKSLG